jgi:hypothetical protein
MVRETMVATARELIAASNGSTIRIPGLTRFPLAVVRLRQFHFLHLLLPVVRDISAICA